MGSSGSFTHLYGRRSVQPVHLVPRIRASVLVAPAGGRRDRRCRRGCRARRPRSRSSSKARIVSTRITTPATIVGARSGCRPAISARSASGAEAKLREQALDRRQREDVAVDPLGVVGVEPELDRGERGRGAGDGDPLGGSRLGPPATRGLDQRRGRRRQAPRARARSGGRRRCGARCGGRRRPAARCGRRSPRRVPTISSVEPPPMSITRVGSIGRPFGGGPEVGEPRLLLAVEDPGREREALAQLGDEGAAVGGVADGAGRDRVDLLDAGSHRRSRRSRRSPRRPPRSPRRRAARRGRPRARAASPGSAARADRRGRRRRRRPTAGSSWCRCR